MNDNNFKKLVYAGFGLIFLNGIKNRVLRIRRNNKRVETINEIVETINDVGEMGMGTVDCVKELTRIVVNHDKKIIDIQNNPKLKKKKV